MQILFEQKDVTEGAASKAVEVVPIPLHPIIIVSSVSCLSEYH